MHPSNGPDQCVPGPYELRQKGAPRNNNMTVDSRKQPIWLAALLRFKPVAADQPPPATPISWREAQGWARCSRDPLGLRGLSCLYTYLLIADVLAARVLDGRQMHELRRHLADNLQKFRIDRLNLNQLYNFS